MFLKKGQIEHLLKMMSSEEYRWFEEMEKFFKPELAKYENSAHEDLFMKFMEVNRYYELYPYKFFYENGTVTMKLEARNMIINNIRSKDELEDLMCTLNLPEFRICNYCGAPMRSGFTDEYEYYCCEEEFYDRMDSLYGLGYWQPTYDDSAEAPYVYRETLQGEWYPTDWYYTEWE